MTATEVNHATVAVKPRPKNRRRDRSRPRIGFWLVLTAVSILFLYPFLWLLSASLKPRDQVFDNLLLPQTWAWGNYVEIWHAAPVAAWFLNSVVVSVAAAVAVTLASSLVAFGFAYFRFPGRNVLFGLVLATMMLPGAVTMIPVYLIWNSVGLAHTQVPLWAGNLFGSAFYIFLLRQFFLGVPREVFEAARVDGASYWTLFRRIALPLCRPALVVSFVFELKASWSDLLKPLIYLRDPALYTLPRGLKALSDQFGQAGEQRWEIVLAGSVVTTVPLLIVFFFAQRHFVAGITTEGGRTRQPADG
jgi:multiple sugar transport system permease protein